MRTLATRGLVSLRPDEGKRLAWQPGIFENSVAGGQLSVVGVYHRVVLAAPETAIFRTPKSLRMW